ncbi:MAG: LacI family DNA-binding transcriptional regulator [Saprospiraceae bacterium]|nr:LacI family DNA-binding transcriptional regulator [Saprospiraceae bacterium]
MMDKKPITIKVIAKKLNISISAVSKALHDDPSIGLRTKMRVKSLAKELNYEPNQLAIDLQKGKSNTIGVILPHLSESFFATLMSGIEKVASENKYVVLFGQSNEDPEKERMLLESMRRQRVDGVIMSISKNTFSYDHLIKYKESLPIVFVDRIPEINEIHYVACNMVSGTFQLVNYLLDKKHRAIGMINGPEKLFVSQERLLGYRQALEKHRLKYDPNLVINSDLSIESILSSVHLLISGKRKASAIIAFHDGAAMEVIKYLKEIKKEKQITVVGYANFPITSHSIYKPAATVEQYPWLQGQKSMEILFEIMNKKESDDKARKAYFKLILDSTLVIL